jgi:Holliday junction resolvase
MGKRFFNTVGAIHREYALGRKCVDLFIVWKSQKIVIEIKIQRSKKIDLTDWLDQTVSYMDTVGSDEGHLVIFDREENKSWEEKIYHTVEKFEGKEVFVWGM